MIDIKEVSLDDLINVFYDDPNHYNLLIEALRILHSANFIESEEYEEIKDYFRQAIDIYLDSKHIIFEIRDSPDKTSLSHFPNGFAIYQLTDNEVVKKIGIDTNIEIRKGFPSYGDVIDYLVENQISKVFTFKIPKEGFYGLKPSHYDIKNGKILYGRFQLVRDLSRENIELIALDIS